MVAKTIHPDHWCRNSEPSTVVILNVETKYQKCKTTSLHGFQFQKDPPLPGESYRQKHVSEKLLKQSEVINKTNSTTFLNDSKNSLIFHRCSGTEPTKGSLVASIYLDMYSKSWELPLFH